MRDKLCDVNYLRKKIEHEKEWILKQEKDIITLQEDMKKGIQTYARSNEECLFITKDYILRSLNILINANYSLGNDCKVLEELYLKAFPLFIEVARIETYSEYIEFIKFISLGILLEIPNEKLEEIVKKADKEKIDDILLDFLINACNLKRKIKSTKLTKIIGIKAYEETIEFINLAFEDRELATEKFKQYMKNIWLKKVFCGDGSWKNAHKEIGYVGLWGFEIAAMAKILKLDDSELKDDNHYPYDLAHYKNEKEFFPNPVAKEEIILKEYEKGIKANKELEKIIPVEFHKIVNEVITDYSTLEDEEFWEKYELNEIWFEIEEYRKDKENSKDGILGFVIVNVLLDEECILQLDWKSEDNLEEELEYLQNYWKRRKVKLVKFDLNNDQLYYMYIPKTTKISNLYEISMIDIAEKL